MAWTGRNRNPGQLRGRRVAAPAVGFLGLRLTATMVVLRLSDGGLLVYSPGGADARAPRRGRGARAASRTSTRPTHSTTSGWRLDGRVPGGARPRAARSAEEAPGTCASIASTARRPSPRSRASSTSFQSRVPPAGDCAPVPARADAGGRGPGSQHRPAHARLDRDVRAHDGLLRSRRAEPAIAGRRSPIERRRGGASTIARARRSIASSSATASRSRRAVGRGRRGV